MAHALPSLMSAMLDVESEVTKLPVNEAEELVSPAIEGTCNAVEAVRIDAAGSIRL